MKASITAIIWLIGVTIGTFFAKGNGMIDGFLIGLIGGLVWTFFLISITKKNSLKENSWSKFYREHNKQNL